MSERKRLFNEGGQTSDIEQAVKDLLSSDVISVLAKRGFLPRYAFPLDVVTLETGISRWLRDTDVELSRDRGIAIAEFAPGAQVIAHKKVFTSAGLYVVSKMDKPDRQWYAKCPSCEQIRTKRIQSDLIGSCPVCQRSIKQQDIQPFVEPDAFSVRIDGKHGSSARYRRSTLIRQRQTLTHFIDHVDESIFQESKSRLFRLALKEDGTLFRYNLGPENKGFVLCTECGFSEPFRSYKAGKKHHPLRSLARRISCADNLSSKPLAYGHQFKSFCMIIRPVVVPASIESLAYSLQRGLCSVLDIEQADIGVSWRRLLNKQNQLGFEIILYDHTPGGAGFVKEGMDNWGNVEREAKLICEKCNCESSCYNCLKSYGNQSHHELLDRRIVVDFFK